MRKRRDTLHDDFRVMLALNWPAPSVLAELNKGDVLELVVRRSGGKKIVTARWKESLAGAIAFARLPELITRIEDGQEFVAEVLHAGGGRCEVLIRRADAGLCSSPGDD